MNYTEYRKRNIRSWMTFVAILLLIILTIIIIINSIPLRLNPKDISKIEIYDTFTDVPKIILISELDEDTIKEISSLYNKSKNFRDDVGTTHPKRVCFMMEDKSIVRLWYGAGFITVSDGNKQFNMQNKRLEDYFNELLQSSIE